MVKRPILQHCNKFSKDRSDHCRDIAIFVSFEMCLLCNHVVLHEVTDACTVSSYSLSFYFAWSHFHDQFFHVPMLGPSCRLPEGPKRIWKEVVREDCQARKLNKEDAVDCCKWRKVIKEVRWPGWVWVGECFFWSRPTRVVPDKRPLNGCCCYCFSMYVLLFFCWFFKQFYC